MFGDQFSGIADALQFGTKIAKVLDKIANDCGIKQQMRTNGYTDGKFTVGNWKVIFRIEDINKRTIDAETVPEQQKDNS